MRQPVFSKTASSTFWYLYRQLQDNSFFDPLYDDYPYSIDLPETVIVIHGKKQTMLSAYGTNKDVDPKRSFILLVAENGQRYLLNHFGHLYDGLQCKFCRSIYHK